MREHENTISIYYKCHSLHAYLRRVCARTLTTHDIWKYDNIARDRAWRSVANIGAGLLKCTGGLGAILCVCACMHVRVFVFHRPRAELLLHRLTNCGITGGKYEFAIIYKREL